jgi:hypothetical protein
MVKTVDSAADLAANLRDLAAEGDIVICMGAGDITKWAAGLADGIGKARGRCRPFEESSRLTHRWPRSSGSSRAEMRSCCSSRRIATTSLNF